MSREDQAGLNGHTLGGERAATVAALPLGEWVGANAAAAAPQLLIYVSAERIENGFIIRGHGGETGGEYATRVAYSPAEAGAAVAELLKRHMAAEDLKGAPEFAVLRFDRPSFRIDDATVVAAVRKKPNPPAKAAKAAKPAPATPRPTPPKKPAAKKPAPKA